MSMSKRKSLPTKISLTGDDEEAAKNEFKTESDLDEDNGIFEEETATAELELNSETEYLDNTPTDEDNRTITKEQLSFEKKSAMINSLVSNAVQQVMKRKHKKFRPSESDEITNNLNNLNSNLNNGNNTNLNSLMNLAMSNNQSTVDLFALSLQSMESNDQLLSTVASLVNANALNKIDQQYKSKDNNLSQQQSSKTTNNNGLFRRRKRSEIEDDDELESNKNEDELKMNNNLTANLLAAITSSNQTNDTLSNLNDTIASTEAQLSSVRKQSPDSETKQDTELKFLEMLKQITELKEKANQQNGNSLVNGSFNSPLDINASIGGAFASTNEDGTSKLTDCPLNLSSKSRRPPHDKRQQQQSPLINHSSPTSTLQSVKANGCSPLNDISPFTTLVSSVANNALHQHNNHHNSTSSSPLLDFNQPQANSSSSLVNSLLPRSSPKNPVNSAPFLSSLVPSLASNQSAGAAHHNIQQQLNTSNNSSLNNSMSNSHLNSSNSNSSCNSSFNNQTSSTINNSNNNNIPAALLSNPAALAAFTKNLQNGLQSPWNTLNNAYGQALANVLNNNNNSNNPLSSFANLNSLNNLNNSTFGKLANSLAANSPNNQQLNNSSTQNHQTSSSANRNSPNTNSANNTVNLNNFAAALQQLANPLASSMNLANLSQLTQLGLNLNTLNNNDLKNQFPYNLFPNNLELALQAATMSGGQSTSNSLNNAFNGTSNKKLNQSAKNMLLCANGSQSANSTAAQFNAFQNSLFQQQHFKQLAEQLTNEGERAKEDDLSAINCEGKRCFDFL